VYPTAATTSVTENYAPNNASYDHQIQHQPTSFDIYQNDQCSKALYEPQAPSNPYKTDAKNSNTVVSQVAAAAAVAAVAANQYLNDSLHATVNQTKYMTTQPASNRHNYSQYTFDVAKPALQDCRRATSVANNHYSHLSNHIPYSGSLKL
jgi:hypothetical protein